MVFAQLRIIAIAQIAFIVFCAGCTPNTYFTASSLPVELAARPPKSAQSIDLSRFSGPLADASRIAEGDVLTISLAAGLSSEEIVEFDVRVGQRGETLLPEIGRLPLGGLDATSAEKMIAATCIHRGLYRHPHVAVTLKEQGKNLVTVGGAVKKPGVYELPRGSSYLVSAIIAAGGIEKNAGTRIVIRQPNGYSILAEDDNSGVRLSGGDDSQSMIRQPQSAFALAAAESTKGNTTGNDDQGVRHASHTESLDRSGVDLICLNLSDPKDKSIGQTILRDGSVVTVEQLNLDSIKVIGLVKKPDQYDYPVGHEIRLLDAIALAGGVSFKAADKVIVLRKLPDGSGFTGIEASLTKAKRNPTENLCLAPGDMVSVEQNVATVIADAIHFVRFGIGASVPLF